MISSLVEEKSLILASVDLYPGFLDDYLGNANNKGAEAVLRADILCIYTLHQYNLNLIL